MKIQILKNNSIHYCSRQTYFSERFENGRLFSEYWNACGQELKMVEPRSWESGKDTFRLSIGPHEMEGNLRLKSMSALTEDHAVISLEHNKLPLVIEVHTIVPDDGFLVRYLTVANRGRRSLPVYKAEVFSGQLWKHRVDLNVDADTPPFRAAYTHDCSYGHEGDFYYTPVDYGQTVCDGGLHGRSGWGRPAFWANDLSNGQTFVCELAWGGNWHFILDCGSTEIRNKINGMFAPPLLRKVASLSFQIGLAGEDILRVLDAGETLTTPEVHFGMFHCSNDEIVQLTHRHVREKIVPKSLAGRINEVEICHRGYLAGEENTADIVEDIKLAKESGMELYMIDAGWFGLDPAKWYASAGNWEEGDWMKEGGGLRTLAKTAHSLGMKFGLWIEAEAAGEDTEIFKKHPNWRLHRNGSVPVGNAGRALDLTQPQVYDHVKNTIAYWITELELDMFRLDHNHWIMPEPNRMYRGYREGLVWRYYEAFYRMITELRGQFPDVMFQNCATGGGRLDWKTISLFHNSEITDCTVEPQQFKILNGVTMSIPPEFLLSRIGLKAKTFDMDAGTFDDLARGMSRLNIRGIAKKKETLGSYVAGEFSRGIRAYKEIFRNLVNNGKLWHHTPFLPVDGTAPWCALECSAQDGSASYAVIMRCRHGENDTFMFYPRGIDPDHPCRVRLLNAKQEFTIPGWALLQNGIRVNLDAPMMAETIVFNTTNPEKETK